MQAFFVFTASLFFNAGRGTLQQQATVFRFMLTWLLWKGKFKQSTAPLNKLNRKYCKYRLKISALFMISCALRCNYMLCI